MGPKNRIVQNMGPKNRIVQNKVPQQHSRYRLVSFELPKSIPIVFVFLFISIKEIRSIGSVFFLHFHFLQVSGKNFEFSKIETCTSNLFVWNAVNLELSYVFYLFVD